MIIQAAACQHNAFLAHERKLKANKPMPMGSLRDPRIYILLHFFKTLQGFHKVRTSRYIPQASDSLAFLTLIEHSGSYWTSFAGRSWKKLYHAQ